MLGEREAVVLEVRRFDIHGSGFVDVTVAFRDRTTATARLGTESVPDALQPGDEVLASMAMNMIVGLRSPGDQVD
jgi:hypothetical protein